MSSARRVLAGLRFAGHGQGLGIDTCLRHLAELGASPDHAGPADRAAGTGHVTDDARRRGSGLSVAAHATATQWPTLATAPIWCELSWRGAPEGHDESHTEATIQALCGLMEVHGRNAGRPRRLGVELASVASGVLATQGVLAALVARLRGGDTTHVETSVLQAGLLAVTHHVARATSGGHDHRLPPPGPDPGPPFRTADGHRFELETLDEQSWKTFWGHLGITGSQVEWGWELFTPRYMTATCTLPPGFHDAAASWPLTEITAAADTAGASVRRVRDCREVLAEQRLPHQSAQPSHGAAPVGAPWGIEGLDAPRAPGRGRPPGHGELPLSGLRVVELARRIQGPLAGLLLSMLGAEVIRVEPPGGDILRLIPPLAGDTSAAFRAFNRGKQTVEADIKTPRGRQAVVDLAADADVFLHNWGPHTAARLGLELDDLAARNPRLVYVHASGWGGALGSRPPVGTDYLVQAYTGLGAALAPADAEPAPSLVTMCDVMGALTAAEGVLAGLVQRELEGRGCRVDTSLLSGAMALQAPVLDRMASGREDGRLHGRPLWGCFDCPLETADGYVVVTVEDDTALCRLAAACGVDTSTPRGLATEGAVAAALRTHPSSTWEASLRAAGVPCAAVRTDLATLPTDPALAGRFEPLEGCWAPARPWAFTYGHGVAAGSSAARTSPEPPEPASTEAPR